MTYDRALPTLTASYTGLVNGDTPASLSTLPTLATVPASSNAGSYAITAGSAVDPDYSITYVPGTLTVNKATVNYTIGNDSQTYGTRQLTTDLRRLIAGVNGQTLDIAYSSTGDTATADVGSYAITGVVSDGTGLLSNYTVNLADGALTISPATPTVTVTDASGTYTSLAFAATGAVTGVDGANLGTPAFTYYSGTYTTAADLSGLTALPGAPVDVGAYTVLASYAGQHGLHGRQHGCHVHDQPEGRDGDDAERGQDLRAERSEPADHRGPERVLRQRRHHGDLLPGGGGGRGELRHYDDAGGLKRQAGRLQRDQRRGDLHDQPGAEHMTAVSSLASGAYGAGTTIPITVTFSQTVTVTGTPQLALNAGSGAAANYTSGSGTSTLTFTYTVAAGQSTSDLDYTSTRRLTLNGGTIQTRQAMRSTLTLPATGTDGLAAQDIAVVPFSDGFESGNFSTWPWQLSSAGTSPANWTVESSVVHAGSFAAQSGAIGAASSSTLSVTLTELPAGEFSFWRKVSSASGSGMLDLRDRRRCRSANGRARCPGSSRSTGVSAGTAHLLLDLCQGTGTPAGSDAAWLDDVQFTPGTTLTVDGTPGNDQFSFDASGANGHRIAQRREPQLRRRRVHELCLPRRRRQRHGDLDRQPPAATVPCFTPTAAGNSTIPPRAMRSPWMA